jgi:hypothetical protein
LYQLPTGWVNVKIDMEVIKEFVDILVHGNTGNDNSAAFTIFRNKLKEFVKLVANKMLHWVKLEQQKLFKRYESYNAFYII